MTDKAIDKIAEIIYRKGGIYLQRKDREKVAKFVDKKIKSGEFKSAEEIARKLETSKTLLEELFDAITVNETYFFRHKSHFDILEREILPNLFSKKSSVKLWSAACSTGEEPYTLGIVALEVLERTKARANVKILANDISKEALKKAQEGVYDKYSIRFVPPDLLRKYFTKTPDGKFKISDRVKRLVQFRLLSITDERDMRSVGNQVDVAMCRNVLIYFDTESRKKALNLIVDNLNKGGYLFLGPAESARGLVEGIKIVLFPGAIVYVKE